MKGVISKVFTNYHLSGNQEAENVYDEWEKFSCNAGDYVVYARALFDTTEMESLVELYQLQSQEIQVSIISINNYLFDYDM